MKIFLLTPDKTNNISFYRGVNPLKRLSEHYDIQYDAGDVIDKDAIKKYDVIMLQNPYLTSHIELIDYCNQIAVKTWVDYDDLIYEASIWNFGAYKEFNNEVTANIVFECIGRSTFTTVSTASLLYEFKDVTDNIYLVENAFDNEFLNLPATIGTSNEVLYRGGESHNEDLWAYRDPILSALKYSTWKPHFVGMNPIYLNEELNGKWTPQLSKPNYWKFLSSNQAKVCIIPLKDTKFNHAKSCIAWIEATYAGCAVLAPNWDEWRKPGVINYDNKVDFDSKLKGMISGRIDLESKVLKSREYILNCQTLLKVNETRFEILTKFVK